MVFFVCFNYFLVTNICSFVESVFDRKKQDSPVSVALFCSCSVCSVCSRKLCVNLMQTGMPRSSSLPSTTKGGLALEALNAWIVSTTDFAREYLVVIRQNYKNKNGLIPTQEEICVQIKMYSLKNWLVSFSFNFLWCPDIRAGFFWTSK